jgi:hypothetical protein
VPTTPYSPAGGATAHSVLTPHPTTHQALWEAFHSNPPLTIRFDDVPWLPTASKDGLDWESCALMVALELDLTALSKIWHPDKFSQKFGKRLQPSHRERVLRRVTVCSQLVNQARDAMRVGGLSYTRPASRAGPPGAHPCTVQALFNQPVLAAAARSCVGAGGSWAEAGLFWKAGAASAAAAAAGIFINSSVS